MSHYKRIPIRAVKDLIGKPIPKGAVRFHLTLNQAKLLVIGAVEYLTEEATNTHAVVDPPSAKQMTALAKELIHA